MEKEERQHLMEEIRILKERIERERQRAEQAQLMNYEKTTAMLTQVLQSAQEERKEHFEDLRERANQMTDFARHIVDTFKPKPREPMPPELLSILSLIAQHLLSGQAPLERTCQAAPQQIPQQEEPLPQQEEDSTISCHFCGGNHRPFECPYDQEEKEQHKPTGDIPPNVENDPYIASFEESILMDASPESLFSSIPEEILRHWVAVPIQQILNNINTMTNSPIICSPMGEKWIRKTVEILREKFKEDGTDG